MNAADRGRLGEDLALGFFRVLGYRCLDRRWRRAGGEIDLVVRRGDVVVFVEVKLSGPGSLGSAVEAVSSRQLGRVRALAGRWCAEHDVGCAIRLDVVTIDTAREGRGLVLRHYCGVG